MNRPKMSKDTEQLNTREDDLMEWNAMMINDDNIYSLPNEHLGKYIHVYVCINLRSVDDAMK